MTERFINPSLATISPAFCLLLIEADEQLANRIVRVASQSCQIIKFTRLNEAEKWLAGKPKVDLVIAAKSYASDIIKLLRYNPVYSTTPVLISCQFIKPQFIKAALQAGATDLVSLDQDGDLYQKIRYYLDLKARILSLPTVEEHSPIAHSIGLPWWKRLLDITVSSSILFVLSPVLLLVSLLIKLDSKGPVLYKSKRAGTNFYVFDMYKFRTMNVQADKQLNELASQNIYAKATSSTNETAARQSSSLCESCRLRGVTCQYPLFDQNRLICEKDYLRESEEVAKFMKFRNDPRITRLGTFLRNSSIDELPQLINILVGDMSLVGNRPLPLYEAEKLTSDEFAQRFAGPAGLTGLWQVQKRAKGQGPMSDEERTQLDITYANTFSFKTDMQILWKTFFSLWQKENV